MVHPELRYRDAALNFFVVSLNFLTHLKPLYLNNHLSDFTIHLLVNFSRTIYRLTQFYADRINGPKVMLEQSQIAQVVTASLAQTNNFSSSLPP